MSRNSWRKTWTTKRDGWVLTSLNVYFQSAVVQETWESIGNYYDLDDDAIPTRQVHARRASPAGGSNKKTKTEEREQEAQDQGVAESNKNPKSKTGEKGDKHETGEKGEDDDTLE
eukprot:CAMPEP_0204605336 /NCGR_PEP_ID=MMETSP0661-20131031/58419_1 /ASSEMBLY_ACC=CAM_ASM_000606 /TAXON_ID=109239 /ORGANISM="Alexandrium margalefi, Strain AMGDE01CS-322" /LENGTH=114 /DNA_ID=CAMNT_0051616567 /DNA_START=134 /DNA_END=478 /DNA_ORIENTATION=+